LNFVQLRARHKHQAATAVAGAAAELSMQQALQMRHAGNCAGKHSSSKQLRLFAASSGRQLKQRQLRTAAPLHSLRTEVAAPPAKDVVSQLRIHASYTVSGKTGQISQHYSHLK
jgi:hypothetical protein